MAFWLVALILTLLVALLVLRPLLRREAAEPQDDARFDLQVYKDQLASVEDDLAKGVLSEDEAEQTRLEISRRILDADKQTTPEVGSGAAPKALNMATVAVGALVLIGSFGLYFVIGAPGAEDQPNSKRQEMIAKALSERPTQEDMETQIGNFPEMEAEAEQSYIDLVANLRKTAESRPDDIRGQELLAVHEARLGRFSAARIAKGRVIELKGDAAVATDYTEYAELMIIAAGGYVSPKSERALSMALAREPNNPVARYYSGLAMAQIGRPDVTYRVWMELLNAGPMDAPWIPPILEQIADVARQAGLPAPNLTAPALRGPTEEQMRDSAEMSDADRQDMIRGMVTQLAERLATEGGSAAEWARLIRAYGVLAETDKAREAWAEAQTVFAGKDAELGEVRSAAQSAGVAD